MSLSKQDTLETGSEKSLTNSLWNMNISYSPAMPTESKSVKRHGGQAVMRPGGQIADSFPLGSTQVILDREEHPSYTASYSC
jgi:hypothetical protein